MEQGTPMQDILQVNNQSAFDLTQKSCLLSGKNKYTYKNILL